jgi:acyl-CoA thioesterase FadM
MSEAMARNTGQQVTTGLRLLGLDPGGHVFASLYLAHCERLMWEEKTTSP